MGYYGSLDGKKERVLLVKANGYYYVLTESFLPLFAVEASDKHASERVKGFLRREGKNVVLAAESRRAHEYFLNMDKR